MKPSSPASFSTTVPAWQRLRVYTSPSEEGGGNAAGRRPISSCRSETLEAGLLRDEGRLADEKGWLPFGRDRTRRPHLPLQLYKYRLMRAIVGHMNIEIVRLLSSHL
jgi:hypothetical protein